MCVCVCVCIVGYCDLSYYVSCVGNLDMIWFDIYKIQDTGSTEDNHGGVYYCYVTILVKI